MLSLVKWALAGLVSGMLAGLGVAALHYAGGSPFTWTYAFGFAVLNALFLPIYHLLERRF